MTRDDVLRMAEEVGIVFREFRAGDKKTILSDGSKTLEVFEAFAAAAYAAGQASEREACAQVCESRSTPGTGSVAILNGAVDAIRARGNNG